MCVWVWGGGGGKEESVNKVISISQSSVKCKTISYRGTSNKWTDLGPSLLLILCREVVLFRG